MDNEVKNEESEIKKPEWFIELEKLAKPEWIKMLPTPQGGAYLSKILTEELTPDQVEKRDDYQVWELIGAYYRQNNRWNDAIAIYKALYYQFINLQMERSDRVHKGMPLVWIGECYLFLGNPLLSKRYLMLTLIEDAISMKGKVDPVTTGSYFRLAWYHGMPDIEIMRYASDAYKIADEKPNDAVYPEFILQELDQNWINVPAANEINHYVVNSIYIEYLLKQLGESSGKVLERLAEYILSCIPGCRTARRYRSFSTDYDVVCSMEGPDVDFRSNFGRYFICECKDWNSPADFTTIAKFIRVLDSVKARFGIIFSKEGITGENSTTNAMREQLKVFQDRGMVIIVINLDDLEYIANSGNLISLMREKYEKVRLDLRPLPTRE